VPPAAQLTAADHLRLAINAQDLAALTAAIREHAPAAADSPTIVREARAMRSRLQDAAVKARRAASRAEKQRVALKKRTASAAMAKLGMPSQLRGSDISTCVRNA